MFLSGMLALVVGPSGAGKDTLISAARDALAADSRFVFCRRIVTRDVDVTSEDHESMEMAQFVERENAGNFFLTWRSHGLAYALPGSIGDALKQDKIVIANVSRGVIETAEGLANTVVVYNITAPPDVLAERLAKRGRESADKLQSRLQRSIAIKTSRAEVIEVENSGAPADAAARFIESLVTLKQRQGRG